MTINLQAGRQACDRCAVCGAVDAACLLDGLLRACRVCEFTWTTAQLAPPEVLYHSGYFEGDGYEDYYQPAARKYEAGRRLRWLLGTGPVIAADTVFSRYYWRPWARWCHVRELLVADWVASGGPSVRHPRLGDVIRLIAWRPTG